MVDTYTKIILTIIATCLSVIVLRDVSLVREAGAQNAHLTVDALSTDVTRQFTDIVAGAMQTALLHTVVSVKVDSAATNALQNAGPIQVHQAK
jgi:acid phosphatase family membrane protein YuiD